MNEDSFSLFFNATGKKIFEYVCTNPGSYLMNVGESMNIDRMVVTRHLEKLHENGMLKRIEYKGRTIYSPKGLRTDDIESAFSQLKNDYRKRVFLFVLNFPNCHQRMIVNYMMDLSERQVRRHVDSLVEARLLDERRKERRVFYNLGIVGKKIVLGSFETIDPVVNLVREKLGHDVIVTMDDGIVHIDMMNGETVSFQLGKWEMMELDEKTIYENRYMLFGEGGEQVLISIYSKCIDVPSIAMMTTLPEKVVRAKIEALRMMRLVVDFEKDRKNLQVTERGKKIVEMLLGIKSSKQ